MIFRTHQVSATFILKQLAYSFSNQLKGFDVFPLQQYEQGQRLDRYLKATAIGWASAQKHLRNGNIQVLAADGKIIRNNGHKFQTGDSLLLKQGLGLQQLLIGDKNINYIEMDFNLAKSKLDDMLIFDNENITIVNKPPGYSVQGGPDPEKNLFSLMAARYRKQMVYISHRLDKPTTGIVLLPKNLKTAQLLGKALQAREGIDKFYLATTQGSEIRQNKGTIACHIEWTNKHKAKISEEIGGNQRSQQAITMFVKLNQKKLSDILWRHSLALKLVTGRKHQIRCHLAQYFLNPIINDQLYLGKKIKDCDQAIFLHAFALKINDQTIIREVLRLQTTDQNIVMPSGCLMANNNQVLIFAKQPSHWLHYSQLLTNQNLMNIVSVFGSDKKVSRKKNRTLKIE